MTNQINGASFTVSPEATASFHDDGVVLLHVGKGSLFTANATGARIWRGLEQQMSLDAIVDQIRSEYQIPRTTAREHAAGFLSELERHTLIQRGVVS